MKLGYFCKEQNGKRDPEHEKATSGAESWEKSLGYEYTSMWSQFCWYDRRREE
jgi:hypothetical protein